MSLAVSRTAAPFCSALSSYKRKRPVGPCLFRGSTRMRKGRRVRLFCSTHRRLAEAEGWVRIPTTARGDGARRAR